MSKGSNESKVQSIDARNYANLPEQSELMLKISDLDLTFNYRKLRSIVSTAYEYTSGKEAAHSSSSWTYKNLDHVKIKDGTALTIEAYKKARERYGLETGTTPAGLEKKEKVHSFELVLEALLGADMITKEQYQTATTELRTLFPDVLQEKSIKQNETIPAEQLPERDQVAPSASAQLIKYFGKGFGRNPKDDPLRETCRIS